MLLRFGGFELLVFDLLLEPLFWNPWRFFLVLSWLVVSLSFSCVEFVWLAVMGFELFVLGLLLGPLFWNPWRFLLTFGGLAFTCALCSFKRWRFPFFFIRFSSAIFNLIASIFRALFCFRWACISWTDLKCTFCSQIKLDLRRCQEYQYFGIIGFMTKSSAA